jgi:methionine--tRNA ligase beta chain
MDTITFNEFAKLDIRTARITDVCEIDGADKLFKLTLDVGELGERTIAAGIKKWYKPKDLVGRQIIYLANLEPKIIRGVESKGMLLAAGDTEPVLLVPDKDVAPGTKIN